MRSCKVITLFYDMARLKDYLLFLALLTVIGCSDPFEDIQGISVSPSESTSTGYEIVTDVPTGISCMISFEERDMREFVIPTEAEIQDEILIEIEVELNQIVEGEAQLDQK